MRRALMVTTFVLAVSAACAACGSRSAEGPSTAHASGAGSGSDMECHEETKTGSSISHEVCRSKFQSDADKKGAQDFMSTPRPAAGQPPS